jgi:hypothetical protein
MFAASGLISGWIRCPKCSGCSSRSSHCAITGRTVMSRSSKAARRSRLPALVDCGQSQQPHQALHPLAVDVMALGRQPCRHPPRTVIGPGQIVPIDQRHNRKILRADLSRLEIHRRAGQCQQPALLGCWQRRVPALDHRAPFRPAQLPSFRAKKIL